MEEEAIPSPEENWTEVAEVGEKVEVEAAASEQVGGGPVGEVAPRGELGGQWAEDQQVLQVTEEDPPLATSLLGGQQTQPQEDVLR